jgi:hypothetical protein
MATGTPIARRAVLTALAAVAAAPVFAAGRATVNSAAVPVVPGPSRVVDGVGVGFAHSRSGALAAGAHSLLEIERAMDTLNPRWTATVAGLVATPTDAAAIRAHATEVIGLERAGGVPLRRVAIATSPVSYTPTAAEVIVLEEWIYATAAREAVWAIERVSLLWRGGEWRVSAITGAAPSANESLEVLRSQLAFSGVGDASVR